MTKHRTGHLYKRNKKRTGNYYLQYRIGGKLISQSLGTPDKKDAERQRDEIMDGLRVADEVTALSNTVAKLKRKQNVVAEIEKKNALTIDEAWDAFVNAGNRNDIADSTLKIYSYYWQRLIRWLSTNYPDVRQVLQVNFDIAENYKTHLTRELKVTGKTFNEHRAFLRTFFNVLHDKAKLDDNPWAKLTRKKYKSNGRDPLTVEELRRVCQDASGELRILLALGFYIGARLGDACTMDWGNVDLKKRIITFTPRKTANSSGSQPLCIPMHETLIGILKETPAAKRKGYVTPSMAKLYLNKGPYAVSNIVQKHFKACGLTTTKDGTGVRKLVSRGFHSLRHSDVSMMREAGVAQTTSQAIVGHNSSEIHELYSHSDQDAMRRAISALPSIIEKSSVEYATPTPAELLRDAVAGLKGMNSSNWKKSRTKAIKDVNEALRWPKFNY